MSHYYDLKSYCRTKANSILVYRPIESDSGGGNICRDVVCTCKNSPRLTSANIDREPKKITPQKVATDVKEHMITWTKQEHTSTSVPEINGPPFWFTLHNGAAHLPTDLSPVSAQRLRNFIDAIPEMQPCAKCSEHARAYIEKNKSKIRDLKKGDEFFNFFVDFHNSVNELLGKPKFSYDQARSLYKNGTNISVMKYT